MHKYNKKIKTLHGVFRFGLQTHTFWVKFLLHMSSRRLARRESRKCKQNWDFAFPLSKAAVHAASG